MPYHGALFYGQDIQCAWIGFMGIGCMIGMKGDVDGMILVIGGAYQGKTVFAEAISEQEQKAGKKGTIFLEFHAWIKECMKEDRNIEEELREKLKQDPDQIIVCNELGCGVVPMDAFERSWREHTGRLTCELAKQADAVYRVACGIGTRIK